MDATVPPFDVYIPSLNSGVCPSGDDSASAIGGFQRMSMERRFGAGEMGMAGARMGMGTFRREAARVSSNNLDEAILPYLHIGGLTYHSHAMYGREPKKYEPASAYRSDQNIKIGDVKLAFLYGQV